MSLNRYKPERCGNTTVAAANQPFARSWRIFDEEPSDEPLTASQTIDEYSSDDDDKNARRYPDIEAYEASPVSRKKTSLLYFTPSKPPISSAHVDSDPTNKSIEIVAVPESPTVSDEVKSSPAQDHTSPIISRTLPSSLNEDIIPSSPIFSNKRGMMRSNSGNTSQVSPILTKRRTPGAKAVSVLKRKLKDLFEELDRSDDESRTKQMRPVAATAIQADAAIAEASPLLENRPDIPDSQIIESAEEDENPTDFKPVKVLGSLIFDCSPGLLSRNM